MSKMVKKFSEVCLSLFSMVAVVSLSSMCFYFLHQPKEPDCLRELAEKKAQ